MKLWVSMAAAALLLASSAWAQPLPLGGGGGVYTVTTTGAVPLTGTASETNLAALRIPANTLGKNGVIEIYILAGYTNSANAKTVTVRFTPGAGAVAGGVIAAAAATATQSEQLLFIIRANNATNSQSFFTTGLAFGTAGALIGTAAIDTTVDSYININGTLALNTETLTLQHAFITVFPSNP